MPVQTELQILVVRPIHSQEESRWNELMNAHHYLGFRQLVGESIKYVAEINHQWVALLGWGTAAFKFCVFLLVIFTSPFPTLLNDLRIAFS